MHLGYNTNGWANHDPQQAIELLAEIGYRSVALTLDWNLLSPYDRDLPQKIDTLRRTLRRLELRSVIETGARFLLNPRVKHEPTLVSADAADRARRVAFLCRAIDIAAELDSDCVSFWAGTVRDGANESECFARLLPGMHLIAQYAAQRGVILGFEPEPGMFIDTMPRFDELSAQVNAPCFQLTLDVGHLHCLGETPIADYVRRYGSRIVNVHIEDMRAGVHEHLQFGEGEMEFPPIIDAFREVGYEGGLHVELSRHSHEAPAAAQRAFDFLQPLMRKP